MRKTVNSAWALLIPALWLGEAPSAHALQLIEGSDGVTVEAILSIKEPTRIRIDGAAITNVFGNIYSSNCGGAIAQQPGTGPTQAGPQVNPAGEIALECDTDKGEIYVRPVGVGGGNPCRPARRGGSVRSSRRKPQRGPRPPSADACGCGPA